MGLKLVPVNVDKTPKIKDWLNSPYDINPDPFTDYNYITSKYKEFSNSDVGIVLPHQYDGKFLGCIDFDIDGKPLESELQRLLSAFPQLLPTVERTKSNRYHVWFLTDAPQVKNYRIQRENGFIEIFLTNKYVIVDKFKLPLAPITAITNDITLDIKALLDHFGHSNDVSENDVKLLKFAKLVKTAYEEGYVNGWDIDRLIDNFPESGAKTIAQIVFGSDYDEKRTEYQISRGEKLSNKWTFGSFVIQIPEPKLQRELKQLYFELSKTILPYGYIKDRNLYVNTKSGEIVYDIKRELIRYYDTPMSNQVLDYIIATLREVDGGDFLNLYNTKFYNRSRFHQILSKTSKNTRVVNDISELSRIVVQRLPLLNKVISHITGYNEKYKANYIMWWWYKLRGRVGIVPVFITTQGVGKNLWHDAMVELFQPHSVIISTIMLQSSFNDWLNGKLLVILDEGEVDQRAMNLLKMYTGSSIIQINQKHRQPFTVNNFADFIIHTNHSDRIYIEPDDRRFLVFTQHKRLTEVITHSEIEDFAKNRHIFAEQFVEILLTYDIKNKIPIHELPFRDNEVKEQYRKSSNAYEQVLEYVETPELIEEEIIPYLSQYNKVKLFYKIVEDLKNGIIKYSDLLEIGKALGYYNLQKRKFGDILEQRGYIQKRNPKFRYFTKLKRGEDNDA